MNAKLVNKNETLLRNSDLSIGRLDGNRFLDLDDRGAFQIGEGVFSN